MKLGRDLEPRYLCDPSKNTVCLKTGCYKNGGPCFLTTHEEFKLDGTKAVSEAELERNFDILRTLGKIV